MEHAHDIHGISVEASDPLAAPTSDNRAFGAAQVPVGARRLLHRGCRYPTKCEAAFFLQCECWLRLANFAIPPTTNIKFLSAGSIDACCVGATVALEKSLERNVSGMNNLTRR